MIVVNIILYIILGYLLLSTAYYLIYSIASVFPSPKGKIKSSNQRRFAVLIPGYKEDAVIVDVAKQALNQTYDNHLFDVIIIADSFQESTLDALRQIPVRVVEVQFEKSTKSKALNKAMETIGDDYDVALVLDADNIMEKDFIEKVNHSFNCGFTAVQGRRVAKNLNTSFAVLDAISEEIGNSVFRKGHRVLGFSSCLAGSGMAFDYAYFKSIMKEVNAVGGFDKELEVRILKDRNKIEYLPKALVFDEKVQKAETFYNQRRRWLSTQSTYLMKAIRTAFHELFTKGNLDLFDKVIQWIYPPKILLLAMVLLFSSLVLIFASDSTIIQLTLALLASTITFFILSIPRKFYNMGTVKAMLSIPYAFGLMLLALFKIKGANKQFIHTQHGQEAKQ